MTRRSRTPCTASSLARAPGVGTRFGERGCNRADLPGNKSLRVMLAQYDRSRGRIRVAVTLRLGGGSHQASGGATRRVTAVGEGDWSNEADTMKVRASVKPRCERCKIIRRRAWSWSSASTRSTSRAGLGLETGHDFRQRARGPEARERARRARMARIAGVDIPRDSRVVASLPISTASGRRRAARSSRGQRRSRTRASAT